jgi:hypothetical protein
MSCGMQPLHASREGREAMSSQSHLLLHVAQRHVSHPESGVSAAWEGGVERTTHPISDERVTLPCSSLSIWMISLRATVSAAPHVKRSSDALSHSLLPVSALYGTHEAPRARQLLQQRRRHV